MLVCLLELVDGSAEIVADVLAEEDDAAHFALLDQGEEMRWGLEARVGEYDMVPDLDGEVIG